MYKMHVRVSLSLSLSDCLTTSLHVDVFGTNFGFPAFHGT